MRKGAHYSGLRILHLDNSVGILGRWDVLQRSSISTIYDSLDGPFLSLSFLFSESEKTKPQVVDISANKAKDNNMEHNMQCFLSHELNEVSTLYNLS